jgi:hypothetical protein
MAVESEGGGDTKTPYSVEAGAVHQTELSARGDQQGSDTAGMTLGVNPFHSRRSSIANNADVSTKTLMLDKLQPDTGHVRWPSLLHQS